MSARAKYRNVKTTVDGITFASAAEARRYGQLKLLERAGHIRDLQMQVRYSIVWNGAKITTYVADFVYFDQKAGQEVREYVKGMLTPVYRIKAKLMAAQALPITEVRA
jgi:hypothetical protein